MKVLACAEVARTATTGDNLIVRGGALSFGYYPDDFAKGHPDVASIGSAMSLRWFPHRR